jgi:hypothetical protein
MSDLQKSITLLKLISWHPVVMPKYHSEGCYRLADEKGNWDPFEVASPTAEGAWTSAPNLYEPEHMVMAWWILQLFGDKYPSFKDELVNFWGSHRLYFLRPSMAQRMWLDKILELSLEIEHDENL